MESIILNYENVDEKQINLIKGILKFIQDETQWEDLDIAKANLLKLHGKTRQILNKFRIPHKIASQQVDEEF